jgi:two-component system phosphate regulon sensor histidine kinase PhoR
LIEKMRLLERIRSSPLEMVESVDLPALAQETVDDHRAQAESKQITLESHFEAVDVPAVMGNPIMLRQAMENLVSNAIKYTRGGGTVSVHTARHDRNFHFEVSDSGIGISEDDLPRVFEPFFRAPNASATDKGTGLGLSLVRSIIEQHGGQVGVESQVGVGSHFWFVLPVTV